MRTPDAWGLQAGQHTVWTLLKPLRESNPLPEETHHNTKLQTKPTTYTRWGRANRSTQEGTHRQSKGNNITIKGGSHRLTFCQEAELLHRQTNKTKLTSGSTTPTNKEA